MALRLAFKINSLLKHNTHKLLPHACQFSNQKPTLIIHPAKKASTYSHPRKWSSSKSNPSSVPIIRKDIETTEQKPVTLERSFDLPNVNDVELQPSAMENFYSPRMESFPSEPITPIRRKFARSSTQNAITMPLKMPRLANPFPEPVKTLPSHTVSDEEKSRLMHEEVKMEARFRLQQQQEMLMQQKYNLRQQQQQNYQQPNNQSHHEYQPQYHQPPFQQPQNVTQSQQPMQNSQPNFRKPKDYLQLENEDQFVHQEQQQFKQSPHVKDEVQPKESAGPQKESETLQMQDRKSQLRGRSVRRPRTRAARYLRSSWYPRSRPQERKYSSNSYIIDPGTIVESEQCEAILQRLKSLHPEYKSLKKPLFTPGSEEEKEFVKNTLKYIAKHKIDIKKPAAPFPSYSEVKTFVREPKINEIKVTSDGTNFKSKLTFKTIPNTRFYSTKKCGKKIDLCEYKKTNERKICPGFKQKNCKKPRPTKCNYITDKAICKKQEAPYPSYSECMEDPYEQEPSECKICPWKINLRAIYRNQPKSGSKHYSTAANINETSTVEAKKKKPCKNPYPDTPKCDYEKTAQKNLEKKRHRRGKSPSSDKKKAAAVATTAAPKVEEETNGTVIKRIKGWLSSWKPESDNIRISKSFTDVDGRETYVIEICEYEEAMKAAEEAAKAKPVETVDTHAVEITNPGLVTATNIPGFMSTDGNDCFKTPGGCPPQKKKDKDKNKRCRKERKRKLPSCENMKKKKKKSLELPIPSIEDKPKPRTTVSGKKNLKKARSNNQVINIQPHEIGILKNKKLPQKSLEEPFKLKSQYWKK